MVRWQMTHQQPTPTRVMQPSTGLRSRALSAIDASPTLPSGVDSACATTAAGCAAGIVHLGLGAFHRAHQALYTEAAIAGGRPALGHRRRQPARPARGRDCWPRRTICTRSPSAHGDEARTRVVGALRRARCTRRRALRRGDRCHRRPGDRRRDQHRDREGLQPEPGHRRPRRSTTPTSATTSRIPTRRDHARRAGRRHPPRARPARR